jgi:hypothetical protein
MRGLQIDRTRGVIWGRRGGSDMAPALYWCLNVPTHPHLIMVSTPTEEKWYGSGERGVGGCQKIEGSWEALATVELDGCGGAAQLSGNLGLAVIPLLISNKTLWYQGEKA